MNIKQFIQDDILNNSICVETFKKKIKENAKRARDDIMNVYTKTYPEKKKSKNNEYKEWRKYSGTGMFLLDHMSQNALVFIPETNSEIILIPPEALYPYKSKRVELNELEDILVDVPKPKLSKDTILKILSYLNSFELLPMRTVCKHWNKWIKNHKSFWMLKEEIPHEPPLWKSLPPYRRYINNMFINIKDERDVINMFFKNPDFFNYIRSLRVLENEHKLDNDGIYFNNIKLSINKFVANHQCKLLSVKK